MTDGASVRILASAYSSHSSTSAISWEFKVDVLHDVLSESTGDGIRERIW